ncbi:MAG TPA: hypothetical protein VNE39_14090 [Planctomycetota bacterium]|nr:hypothetical protein [Planctomycetota bacterium]
MPAVTNASSAGSVEVIRIGHQRGYTHAELSWVSEGNLRPILTIEQALKPELYKVYRVYGKPL